MRSEAETKSSKQHMAGEAPAVAAEPVPEQQEKLGDHLAVDAPTAFNGTAPAGWDCQQAPSDDDGGNDCNRAGSARPVRSFYRMA